MTPVHGEPPTVDVLGTRVASMGLDDFTRRLTAMACEADTRSTVLYANPHVLNVAATDPTVQRQLAGADLVFCDGTGVRLGARILGHRMLPRITCADIVDPLCRALGEADVASFFVGGEPGVADEAARILSRRHPGFRVVGSHHGFVQSSEVGDLLARIEASGAGLLWLGMGTPAQEHWLSRYRARLEVPAVWAVGALFDWVTGGKRRAPAWMHRNHLEWVWRLVSEPRRLGARYLVGNPLFLGRVVRQRLAGPARGPDAGG